MDYATQAVPMGQLDKELTDTCYTMEIDPNYEYYYNVRAKNGSVMSVATPDMWVDGILGVKVEAKEATGVSKTLSPPTGPNCTMPISISSMSSKSWRPRKT